MVPGKLWRCWMWTVATLIASMRRTARDWRKWWNLSIPENFKKGPMPAIVITGAAKRVGKALAEFFADRDWEVGLHYNRSGKEAEDLARRLQQRFPHRHFPDRKSTRLNSSHV